MARRRSDPPLLERFWAKVEPEPTSGCWLWIGAFRVTGYAYGCIRNGREGVVLAHRFAYTTFRGPIPEGMEIDHLCRTPACVNPAHLEPVPGLVNFQRGNASGARYARTNVCDRGHSMADAYVSRRRRAGRIAIRRACRYCVNASRMRLSA